MVFGPLSARGKIIVKQVYYIFILDLTTGFNGLGKDNCKTGRES